MHREWTPDDLIANWTLVEDDWRLVGNKTGSTRLGFALLLKFFELEGRFPRHAGEVPKAAVDYMAQQVKVEPVLFSQYAWSGRTIEYHRAQVRRALGFREPSVEDEARLGWTGRWPPGAPQPSSASAARPSGDCRRRRSSCSPSCRPTLAR